MESGGWTIAGAVLCLVASSARFYAAYRSAARLRGATAAPPRKRDVGTQYVLYAVFTLTVYIIFVATALVADELVILLGACVVGLATPELLRQLPSTIRLAPIFDELVEIGGPPEGTESARSAERARWLNERVEMVSGIDARKLCDMAVTYVNTAREDGLIGRRRAKKAKAAIVQMSRDGISPHYWILKELFLCCGAPSVESLTNP